jgi:hypothetical protein
VDVSGGLSVTGESQFYGGFYVRGKRFGDTVVIDGTVCRTARTPFVGIIDISGTPRYGDVIPYKDGCGGKCGYLRNVTLEDLASSEDQQVHIRLNDGKHDPGCVGGVWRAGEGKREYWRACWRR